MYLIALKEVRLIVDDQIINALSIGKQLVAWVADCLIKIIHIYNLFFQNNSHEIILIILKNMLA